MPSDKTTVATTADFAPTVVGGTDRERSIVSSAPRAHDGTSQRHRPEVRLLGVPPLGWRQGNQEINAIRRRDCVRRCRGQFRAEIQAGMPLVVRSRVGRGSTNYEVGYGYRGPTGTVTFTTGVGSSVGEKQY